LRLSEDITGCQRSYREIKNVMILKRTLQLQWTHEEREKGNKSSRVKMVKRIKERRNRKDERKIEKGRNVEDRCQ
jgi:hypothetical protein